MFGIRPITSTLTVVSGQTLIPHATRRTETAMAREEIGKGVWYAVDTGYIGLDLTADPTPGEAHR